MIETLAENLAIRIKRANREQTASVAVMKFALIIIINFCIPISASLLIGAVTGKVAETAIGIGFFILLRMISGGYHFASPIPCMLSTAAVTAIPPHLTFSELWTPVLTAGAFILVALLAPANMKGYNTMPEKYYPLLKFISMLIVASNFLLQSQTVAIVLAIQGLTLLFHNKDKEVSKA
ncbi:accessory gene regulator ArgB-like protein [Cohnella laeviribosi]|uniref:accessory gene regulator ArgB-like protein n=1 Tax=Cohnella laeviribosi TaxID=380174 RepID=UPI003D1E53FE